MNRTRFTIMLAIVWIGAGGRVAGGQQMMLGPSTSLEDAVSQFANPALISFQRSRLALGARAYHLGLGDAGGVPLRQGYVLLSSPFMFSDRFGAGGHVQYFDSPVFRRVAFGASVSARLLRYLSAGVRLEAMNLSYNPDNFVGFDPRDPVFADGFGRTVFNVSAGFFGQPLPNLRVSAGIRNLNRPDLSLAGDGVRLRTEPFLGAAYGIGAAQAILELVDTQDGLETRFGAEWLATSGSFLRVSSNQAFDAGRVEGQLYIGGPLSVAYGYELPLGELGGASGGSHTFSVVLEFGRTPDLPDPAVIPSFVFSNELPAVVPQLAPKVYISSSTDYVRFVEQRIVRSVDKDVPAQALRQLSAADLGRLDDEPAPSGEAPDVHPVESVSREVRLQGTFSPLYRASMRVLGRALARGADQAVTITSAGERLLKAAGVRNYMIDQEHAPPDRVVVAVRPTPAAGDPNLVPEETRISFDPERVVLHINSSLDGRAVQSWSLRIRSIDGVVVRSFEGAGALPARIEWDWRDDRGGLIEPGVYRYGVEWVDAAGQAHASNERKLYVQKLLRKITIEVTRDIEALQRDADAVEIRIQH